MITFLVISKKSITLNRAISHFLDRRSAEDAYLYCFDSRESSPISLIILKQFETALSKYPFARKDSLNFSSLELREVSLSVDSHMISVKGTPDVVSRDAG